MSITRDTDLDRPTHAAVSDAVPEVERIPASSVPGPGPGAGTGADEFADLSVGELVDLCSRVVGELSRRVALAQYGTAQVTTNARDLAAQVNSALESGDDDDHASRVGALSGRDAVALTSGPFAVTLVHQAVRASDQLRAVASLAAARVEATQVWAADGSRSVNAYLIRSLRVAPGTASALVRTGCLIRDHMPAMGRAVLAGKATWDHAVAAKHAATSVARRDALAAAGYVDHMGRIATGDEQLTYQSGSLDAGQFAIAAKHCAARTDPDADERGYKDAVEREYVSLSPTLGGYHLEGFLTQEHGKLVQTAIEGVIGVPAADDTRTPPQRRAQGLADVAGIALSQGEVGTSGRVKPQLVVTVPFETLQAMAARTAGDIDLSQLIGLEPAQWGDGTGPLPPGLLARLACDSAVARVVFGPRGEVLNQGRTYRTFTAAQRAALVARDKHCQFPGCTAPPKQCEGHHLVFWSHGGATDLDNALLLCWHCHDYVHTGGIAITKTNAGFAFTRPDGSTIA